MPGPWAVDGPAQSGVARQVSTVGDTTRLDGWSSLAGERIRRLVGRAVEGSLARVGPHLGPLATVGDGLDAVLTYHGVGDPGAYGNVSVDRFRSDLATLTSRATVVDLPALLDPAPGDGVRVAVTFDDGYTGVHDHVLPLLAEFDVDATVFVCADVVRGECEAVADRFGFASPMSDAERCRRFLDAAQLRRVADSDHVTVGNHSRTHADLTAVDDPAVLRSEVVDGRRRLADLVDRPVDRFSYPYGRWDPETVATVRDSHDLAVTTMPLPVGGGADRMLLPRLAAHVPVHELRWHLTPLRWWLRGLLRGGSVASDEVARPPHPNP